MKKALLLASAVCGALLSYGQMTSFPGYRAGNFTGVNGVFFNPSSIADSRYRWDVNLFSLNIGLANNKASYKLKDLTKNFDDDDLKNKILSGNGSLDAQFNIDILGPSVLFNLSPKHSIALSTRVRAMANIREMDGTLVNSIIDAGDDADLPYTLASNKNSRITVNGWTEFGLSYARVLHDEGAHFFKAGATLKYLAGIGNTYMQINGLTGTIQDDAINGPYLDAGAHGTVGVGVGGINISSLDDATDAFKFNGSGIGADLGFTYEWRPDGDRFTRNDGKERRDVNKYRLKVALALLDIGKIKYKRDIDKSGTYSLNVQTGDRFSLDKFDGVDLDSFKSVLNDPANNPRYFTSAAGNNDANYKVMLPTSLAVDVDLNLYHGFYVDLAGQFALTKKDAVADAGTYSGVTLTPRFEGGKFGFYLPINYNSISNFNAGVSLRIGPFFVGSGSVLTALMDKTKQADIHFGFRFGSLFKNKRDKAENLKEKASASLTVDTDSDGIIDADDKCPTVAGLAKYNGCPIPDTDKDGVNDEEDKCPDIAGLAKYNGCPIPDTDKDGVNDEEDKCPTVAGVAKYNGCPIPDTDKDGINDEEDKCPTVAGSPRYNGCPVPDTDNDGVNDEEDKCPTVAGAKENGGCPVIKEEVRKKVEFAAQKLLFTTGKSVILKQSYAQLNNVVAILKSDETLKIDIAGHTDDVGADETNLKLSQARADAARDYFVSHGIGADRLTSTGYGETKPIADNKTAKGRTQNRRVEFVLRNY